MKSAIYAVGEKLGTQFWLSIYFCIVVKRLSFFLSRIRDTYLLAVSSITLKRALLSPKQPVKEKFMWNLDTCLLYLLTSIYTVQIFVLLCNFLTLMQQGTGECVTLRSLVPKARIDISVWHIYLPGMPYLQHKGIWALHCEAAHYTQKSKWQMRLSCISCKNVCSDWRNGTLLARECIIAGGPLFCFFISIPTVHLFSTLGIYGQYFLCIQYTQESAECKKKKKEKKSALS